VLQVFKAKSVLLVHQVYRALKVPLVMTEPLVLVASRVVLVSQAMMEPLVPLDLKVQLA
jgi:hypothetical protein